MRSIVFFACFAIGCSGGDFSVGNGGTEDGSVADSAVDSGGSAEDGGDLVDSSTTDSGASDSGSTSEGGVVEGGVVEAGSMCPKPPSTKSYDFSMLGCDKLQDAYAEALANAKVCECDAACSATLPDNFCNNCQSFVAPSTDAYRAAKALFDEWQLRTMTGKCAPLACPDFLCPPPMPGGCHGSGAGSTRTCRNAM
jgi:hypothetical protein